MPVYYFWCKITKKKKHPKENQENNVNYSVFLLQNMLKWIRYKKGDNITEKMNNKILVNKRINNILRNKPKSEMPTKTHI